MLIFGWKMFQNHEKMKLLFWMSGIDDLMSKDLEKFPEENLGDVMILLHLLKV